MNIKLKYGRGKIDFDLVEENYIGDILLEENTPFETEEDAIIHSLENPIGAQRLRDIVKPNEKICIIVSDVTRMYQRMYVYIPYIIRELEKAGVEDKDVCFLIATGTHRTHTKEEHQTLLTPDIYERFQVVDHICEDKESMVHIGSTSRGTPVILNRIAVEADHVITTGAIVYHMMAGWAGGRKSIVPGISARETIMKNHAHSLSEKVGDGPNKHCDCGAYDTNPVNLDMIEAAKIFNPTFMFNVILGDGKIIDAVCGDIEQAFKIGCEKVRKYNDVEISKQGDLVVASCGGYPKDINYYQSTKTIYNAMRCVKPGGVVIILADCEEGYGNEEVEYIMNGFKNNYEREVHLKEDYTIGKFIGYLALYNAEIYTIIFVTSMDKGAFENCNIYATKDINEALALAHKIKGTNKLETYIMPNGGVFPVMKVD